MGEAQHAARLLRQRRARRREQHRQRGGQDGENPLRAIVSRRHHAVLPHEAAFARSVRRGSVLVNAPPTPTLPLKGGGGWFVWVAALPPTQRAPPPLRQGYRI